MWLVQLLDSFPKETGRPKSWVVGCIESDSRISCERNFIARIWLRLMNLFQFQICFLLSWICLQCSWGWRLDCFSYEFHLTYCHEEELRFIWAELKILASLKLIKPLRACCLVEIKPYQNFNSELWVILLLWLASRPRTNLSANDPNGVKLSGNERLAMLHG